MSQFLSIEIGTDFLLFASGNKTGDNSFSIDRVKHVNLSLNLEKLELALTSQLTEIISSNLKDWEIGNDLIVSYNAQSTFLKTIKFENDVSKKVQLENVEWEIAQVSGGSRDEFSFFLNEDLINYKHMVIAFRKQRIEFAKELALSLNLNLSSVGLNSANILNLVDVIGSNALLLNINNTFVEIAVVINGHFEELLTFPYKNGIDLNDININLRKINDSCLSNGTPIEHLFLSGRKVTKSDAEHVSNAVQIPIEIIDPFKTVDFVGEIEDNTEPCTYASCVGAFFQL